MIEEIKFYLIAAIFWIFIFGVISDVIALEDNTTHHVITIKQGRIERVSLDGCNYYFSYNGSVVSRKNFYLSVDDKRTVCYTLDESEYYEYETYYNRVIRFVVREIDQSAIRIEILGIYNDHPSDCFIGSSFK